MMEITMWKKRCGKCSCRRCGDHRWCDSWQRTHCHAAIQENRCYGCRCGIHIGWSVCVLVFLCLFVVRSLSLSLCRINDAVQIKAINWTWVNVNRTVEQCVCVCVRWNQALNLERGNVISLELNLQLQLQSTRPLLFFASVLIIPLWFELTKSRKYFNSKITIKLSNCVCFCVRHRLRSE